MCAYVNISNTSGNICFGLPQPQIVVFGIMSVKGCGCVCMNVDELEITPLVRFLKFGSSPPKTPTNDFNFKITRFIKRKVPIKLKPSWLKMSVQRLWIFRCRRVLLTGEIQSVIYLKTYWTILLHSNFGQKKENYKTLLELWQRRLLIPFFYFYMKQ